MKKAGIVYKYGDQSDARGNLPSRVTKDTISYELLAD